MRVELYKNAYRIPSARLPGWDYSTNGYYFITICTKNRIRWFGDIVDKKMRLSDVGRVVHEEWIRTQIMRKNVGLDEFIIMPDHFHALIRIKNNPINVETHCNASLPNNVLRNNVSHIIRGFKSASTKRIHHAGYHHFAWQSRFYDRIIRNEHALYSIRQYIRNNPSH